MRYAGINRFDIADGPGVRVAVFVSGCRNACRGCFNKAAQRFDYGAILNEDAMGDVMEALARPGIDGLTILGGEPLEPENQEGVATLIRRVRTLLPSKDIWLYTGFVFEDLHDESCRAHTETLYDILRHVAVMVDGPFVEARKDPRLKFRGSSNQRLIDMPATLAVRHVVECKG